MSRTPLRQPKTLSLAAGAAVTIAGAAFLLAPGSAPQAVAASAAQEVRAGAYEVDAIHSNVNFSVVYMGSSHFFGRFNEFSGSYLVDPENLEESFIDLTIKTASVDTNSEKRDEHMRGPDFFAARQFPNATFVSTGAEKIDDSTLRFTGDFTIRGITQEIQVDVENVGSMTDPSSQKTRSGWITTFTFNRSDYNVSYRTDFMSDETELTVSMTGLQK